MRADIVLVDASRDVGAASAAIRRRAIDPPTRVTSSGKRHEYVPLYAGRFDAYKLEAQNTDVLFASYPAGTSIPTHSHDTDNSGVIKPEELIVTMNNQVTKYVVGDWYQVPAGVEHAARFEKETDEIEFWFSAETERNQLPAYRICGNRTTEKNTG